jgi:hypothetical protein
MTGRGIQKFIGRRDHRRVRPLRRRAAEVSVDLRGPGTPFRIYVHYTTPRATIVITSNLVTTFVRPCHLADWSALHQSTIAVPFSLLLNVSSSVATAIE